MNHSFDVMSYADCMQEQIELLLKTMAEDDIAEDDGQCVWSEFTIANW